jgi:hypothetical protein
VNVETAELERERVRLDAEPRPTTWDRASWVRGAAYALAWVINRRGASIPPLEAARMCMPDPPKDATPPQGSPEGT